MVSQIKKYSPIIIILILSIIIFTSEQKPKYSDNSIIVRVSYTGIENMFHDRYEYYVISDGRANKSSKAEDKLRSLGIEEASIYDDENTNMWFITFSDMQSDDSIYGDSAGIEYYMSVYEWTNKTRTISDKEIELIQQAVDLIPYDTYKFQFDGMSAMIDNKEYLDGEEQDLGKIGNIMLIENSGRYVIILNDTDIYTLDKENIVSIKYTFTKPDRSYIDYIYWDIEI